MAPELLFFYIISVKLVILSLVVVLARNPIYSVLALIGAFLCGTGLFLLAGAEFLAWILAIVYVGAVAILFLFAVMMFDVDFDSIRERMGGFGWIGAGASVFLLTEIIAAVWYWESYETAKEVVSTSPSAPTNTVALGDILYTDYALAFQLSGLILLVAMIGAITLTLKDRFSLKHQNVNAQLDRHPKNTLKMMKVESRKGLQP